MQGEGSAASKAGVGRLANLGVTLQRRWANVLSDYTRQGVVECFLGLKLKEHFPSVSIATGQQPLPLDESEDDEADLESAAPGSLKDKVDSLLLLEIPLCIFSDFALFYLLCFNVEVKPIAGRSSQL